MRLVIKLTALLGLAVASLSGWAGSLGAIGHVYPIHEPDALETIRAKLHYLEKTGELARLQQAAVARSLATLEKPAPVEGISTTTKRATRYFDPSVVLTRAITDQDGREIAPAGKRINPLDSVGLSSRLVFFDGSDADQVAAVQRLKDRSKGKARIKPILVAGSWLDLSRSWREQVYYDQFGSITRRLGITRVPSLVSQDGKRLKIEEVPAEELQ